MRPQRSKLNLKPHYDASPGQCVIRCKTALSLQAPASILPVMMVLSGTLSPTQKEP